LARPRLVEWIDHHLDCPANPLPGFEAFGPDRHFGGTEFRQFWRLGDIEAAPFNVRFIVLFGPQRVAHSCMNEADIRVTETAAMPAPSPQFIDGGPANPISLSPRAEERR